MAPRTSLRAITLLALALLVLATGCTTDSSPDMAPEERDTAPETSPTDSQSPEIEITPEDIPSSETSATLPGEDSHFGFEGSARSLL